MGTKSGIGNPMLDIEGVLLRCPICGRYREVSYVGRACYGSKDTGAVWRCGYCGSIFETGPALTASLLNEELACE